MPRFIRSYYMSTCFDMFFSFFENQHRKLTGYNANEVVGRTITQHFENAKTNASSFHRIEAAFAAGQSCVELICTSRKDRSTLYCLWVIEPLRDVYGDLACEQLSRASIHISLHTDNVMFTHSAHIVFVCRQIVRIYLSLSLGCLWNTIHLTDFINSHL